MGDVTSCVGLKLDAQVWLCVSSVMSSRQLVVFGLVLACVGFSDARVLGRREPAYRRLEAHKPAEDARPRAGPERGHSRPSAEPAGGLQVKIYPELEPLTWSFPVQPVEPAERPPVRFEPRRPDTTNRVAVRCGESGLQVEVSQDLLGLGRLIEPERVTLGGCPVTEVDHRDHVLVFEAELHSCGSTLVMTDSAFIYAFTLVYEPAARSWSPITRSQATMVGVECHYPR